MKGEFEKRVKYDQGCNVDLHREIGYKQGEAMDLGNIGNIYAERRTR